MYTTELKDIKENKQAHIFIEVIINTEITREYSQKITIYRGPDNAIADSIRRDLNLPIM
jgi:hypothetical protein